MTDPVFYGSIPGIFTYRGNNFRNCASYGYTNIYRGALTQRWEFRGIGKKLASTQNFEWSGVRWTGQPLVAEWPLETRAHMNLTDFAKNQQVLREVIIAALDGKIYFFNILNGEKTREPINVGASIKGTPALDPRGYPIIYVGQTDNNGGTNFGLYVYSLLDGSLLYMYDGSDDGAYRSNWNAFDSSPIIDGATDTLIWPCENGYIYTFDLNTPILRQTDRKLDVKVSVCGTTYDIHITKPEGFIRAQDGIKVSLDGAAVEGTLLPVATDGKTHQVEISF